MYINEKHEYISSEPPFTEWHVRCTFETFISPSFLKQEMHVKSLYVGKPQMKKMSFQNEIHVYFMQS